MQKTLDILGRLIAFDSVSRNSNLPIIAYIEAFLCECGFHFTRLKSPNGDKAGLYAQSRPEEGGILLSAHTDVVPIDGQKWTRPAFALTVENNRLYGRGTTDMKGFIASMLAAADKASGLSLKEPLKLLFSYDEEIGCVGMGEMLDRLPALLKSPRLSIVGEPTEMRLATGHKGKIAFTVTCHGEAGHSALAPQYVNALYMATDFIREIQTLQNELAENGMRDEAYAVPHATIHIGKLEGGTALNIVPDKARLEGECRFVAQDSVGKIFGEIEAVVKKIETKYQRHFSGARIELKKWAAYPGLATTENAPALLLAQKLAGFKNLAKVDFGTEAGFFAEMGVPTVVCGPGSMENQGHKADEYLALDQLEACQNMMGRILRELEGQ